MANFSTRSITIKGIVQGVGFRPFVYAAAKENNIAGSVRNSSAGVEIVASGSDKDLDAFQTQIKTQPPPLSKIDHFDWSSLPKRPFEDFIILESKVIPGEFIPISPDISICEDCRQELFDPQNFRFRYPFINCTNCGPRLTIIKDIPYDRPLTTMASYPICTICEHEYNDPSNRRFHAQPIACSKCGPSIWFETEDGSKTFHEDGLIKARNLLKNGGILAIKGLGGFHLACDAANDDAVMQLRTRKRRSQKPFAVMAFSQNELIDYCHISAPEVELLEAKEKPIVIVNQKIDSGLSSNIAPGRHTVGIMLPYTPLHYLLLEPAEEFPKIFVMTSGNISEEPIAYQNAESKQRLGKIADGYLLHDRDINLRIDDSVTTLVNNQPYFFRRSRGYAPRAISIPKADTMDLAVGAELKNTFCLTKNEYAFISHHIGDLQNFETYQAFSNGIEHYCNLFNIDPQRIICDLHPEYLSTKFAHTYAIENDISIMSAQHHHAHLAACLADNGCFSDAPAIGFIFDGTGYGDDGNIWGGEVLVGNAKSYQRRYHLEEMPLPGGDKAILNPNRIALAYMIQNNINLGRHIPTVSTTPQTEINILTKQLEQGINVPLTTSMGRLFDAVASLLGIRQSITYEAQAAIELEQMLDSRITDFYEIDLLENIIRIKPLITKIIADIQKDESVATISARFHNSIAHIVLSLANLIREQDNINTVVLSGGVWQNKYLLETGIQLLESAKFSVLHHHQIPTNDGGISLGQAAILRVADRK